MTSTRLATANVNHHLGRRAATEALDRVLEHDPDLVGLQEWWAPRWGLLRHRTTHRWLVPLVGGCVLGVRRSRYTVLARGRCVLSPPGRADRGERPLGAEPPRVATVATLRDAETGRSTTVVGYHLVSGVQAHDAYRDDRPLLVARHRREATALRRAVADGIAAGHEVHALGDSNWHGFALPGLVSAWQGREDQPGSLGPRRHVDDVFSPRPASSLRLVETPSDHRAVVVDVPVAGGGSRA